MNKTIKNVLKKLPFSRDAFLEIEKWRAEKDRLWVPLEHYYSPIASLDEIRLRENELFNSYPKEIPGVDLNEKGQINLLNEFKGYYNEQPFGGHKKENLRYFFENPAYSYSDAIILYCMMRHARPKNVIEVGSGYSSCVILDTNELFFNNGISCTFIDPYPALLQSLLKDNDKDRIDIIPKKLQDVDINRFASLTAGDILFIDSTHVSKIGSDVNQIFFTILPFLKSGVYIHFHDIFYPFEYPKEWIYEGRAWNEAYLLRTFLQYNSGFKIQFFNTFLEYFYEDEFRSEMPLCMKNKGGSIWIKKVKPTVHSHADG